MLFRLSSRVIRASLSRVMRIELLTPRVSIMDRHRWNVQITAHRLVIIFFFIMPFLIGRFRNWLIPLMVGCPDMAFPRINNLSFWVLVPAFNLMASSTLIGRIRSGWTIYPPLSSRELPIDYAIFALHIARISSILGRINFITTMILFGVKIFNYFNVQLFLWAMMVTVFILVTTLPVLAARITMILFDRHFNCSFFDASRRGDPILFQHLFWFFRHPEVYVLILPRFRMLSHVVPFYLRLEQPLRFYRIIWSILAIRFVRYVVWAHHIFSVGIDTDSKAYFSGATIVIGLPTRVKVFNWIRTCAGRSVEYSPTVLWAFYFIWLFLVRGVTRIVLSNTFVDLLFHDTYYVVAHFHYVLSMRATYSLIMGIFHWWPLLFRGVHHTRRSAAARILLFVGVNLIFMPIHFLRIERMPRRYVRYVDYLTTYNLFPTLGVITALLSVAAIVFIMYTHDESASHHRIINSSTEYFYGTSTQWHTNEEPPFMR